MNSAVFQKAIKLSTWILFSCVKLPVQHDGKVFFYILWSFCLLCSKNPPGGNFVQLKVCRVWADAVSGKDCDYISKILLFGFQISMPYSISHSNIWTWKDSTGFQTDNFRGLELLDYENIHVISFTRDYSGSCEGFCDHQTMEEHIWVWMDSFIQRCFITLVVCKLMHFLPLSSLTE